jgi:ketosteroid isomerase-like protein
MSEESTTPDLVEFVRSGFAALNSDDLDAWSEFFAREVVWDLTRTLGIAVEGRYALRAFQDDWLVGYDEFAYTVEEIIDAGNGVGLAKYLQTARPRGSDGSVTQREAAVLIIEGGLVARVSFYPQSEIDEARAAAERLAEERG